MDIRRTTAVIVIWAVVIAGALPATAHTRAQAQDVATDLAAICPDREESIELGERPQHLAAVQSGIAVRALAHHSTVQLPEGIDFILSLDHLTLAPGTETKSRRTAGPTLFLVEEGTVAVIDSGRAHQLAGRPGSEFGESVLVERNRLVKLKNTGNASGNVLLLGLLPPEGQLPIGALVEPARIWIPFPEEREQLIHRQMFAGEIVGLAREETLLFATCLHWTNLAFEIEPARYPGPVGLLVLRGEALVNETERIGAGMCWLSPSYASLRIRAGVQAPVVVFFGALRTPAQPQIGAGGSDASSSLDCTVPVPADQTEDGFA